MPSKNKSKEKNSSKNKKRAKSVLQKKTKNLLDSNWSISNKKNINKKHSIKSNNFFTSLKELNSINNELDSLSINLDFKFNHYHKNIVLKNNNSNQYSENKSHDKINSYFYENKKRSQYNTSTNNNSKIKVMDNLYLYKQKNSSFKIYRQPELITFHSNNSTFKNNYLKFSKLKPKLNNYRIRNVFLPSRPYLLFNKKKKFNINNINNACKILLSND